MVVYLSNIALICNNNVICFPAVADLIQGIEECDGLDTLVLSGRSFGVKASEAIGRTLSGKSTLKKALWSDMFVSKLKTEIPPALVSFLYCLVPIPSLVMIAALSEISW